MQNSESTHQPPADILHNRGKLSKHQPPELENLKLSESPFHKHIYTFDFMGKRCYLVPVPHLDMKHNFMLAHQYKDVGYHFSLIAKGETMISFFGTQAHNGGNYYNVIIPEHCTVVELAKISNLSFHQRPNPKFTYLVCVPL